MDEAPDWTPLIELNEEDLVEPWDGDIAGSGCQMTDSEVDQLAVQHMVQKQAKSSGGELLGPQDAIVDIDRFRTSLKKGKRMRPVNTHAYRQVGRVEVERNVLSVGGAYNDVDVNDGGVVVQSGGAGGGGGGDDDDISEDEEVDYGAGGVALRSGGGGIENEAVCGSGVVVQSGGGGGDDISDDEEVDYGAGGVALHSSGYEKQKAAMKTDRDDQTGETISARLRIEQGSIYSRGARVGSMLACDDDREVIAVIVTGSDPDGAGVIISRYRTPAIGRLKGKLNPDANWSHSDSSEESDIEYESDIEFHDVHPRQACLGITYHEGRTARKGIGYIASQLELIPTCEAEVQVNAEGDLIWPTLPAANLYLQRYYSGLVAKQLQREFSPSIFSQLALDVAKQAVGHISLAK